MKVFSIVNQKGGSGKTTLSSLIVKTLSESGARVLAIDTDPQAGLSSILLGKEQSPGLCEFLMKSATAEESIHETEGNLFSGKVGVMPASYRLDKVFLTTNHLAFKPLLKLEGWDFVVIDTPPTVQGITRTALEISSRVFVPTEISKQSLAPTTYTLQAIAEQEKKAEIILSGWKDPGDKGGYQAELSREFMQSFQESLAGIIPRNSSTVSFASEWKKASASHKQGIIATIKEILGEK